ncbi:hypothetical protein GCM10022286_20260 [Gryllotalpicola daejeonensis]|uniref:Methyltransferase type 11 domain-containing protein n=1 Tax=Gryllotalpicola daejeonensis TaxID=993087 RepID=A0ABP7ZKP6_9MICO
MAFAEWAGIAAPYDRSFGALCACTIPDLLAELRPELGAHTLAPEHAERASRNPLLLDVGTGTGSVAIAAAAAGWQVDAFDAEQSMIDFAARRPDAAGIRFTTAKLPHLPYPDDAFDAAAANFAINHVDHPRESLAELRRVLKPGGRFAATVWPWGKAPSATAVLWREIQDETGAYPPPGNRLPADSDFDRSEAGLSALFAECGFVEVRARRLEFEWAIDADDLWSGVEAGIALIGYAYRAADAPTKRRMREAYDARTPAFTGADGLLHFPQAAVLAVGVRPGQASDRPQASDS